MSTQPTSKESALLADEGLCYVTDHRPGITRKRRRGGFAYFRVNGDQIHDENDVVRLNSLAIPPAWEDVWICPHRNGHLQATGRDARGRKQYRYHPKWRAVRDSAKYGDVGQFAQMLPQIRARVAEDMAKPGLPREKVLASVVRLLETTLIRVGNAEYARDNDSYGLTTMRRKHVDVKGSEITFHFPGKSGQEWELELTDRRLARIVKKCSELPGYEIFTYENEDGKVIDVTSADINVYLKDITGADCTAKDFRTWAGTVLATVALDEFEAFDSDAQARKNVVRAIERVAGQMGNTPAICRSCYVHPAILESYLDGELASNLSDAVSAKVLKEFEHLQPEELMVLAFLRKRLESGTLVGTTRNHG